MASTDVISIVVPVYNTESFLSATLESVIAQTYPHWEMIIVDDGSKDASFAIAQEFAERDSRIRALQKLNLRTAAARNNGLKQCTPHTPYVMFLDADDVLLPNALDILLLGFENNPEAVGVYGCAQSINAGGELINIGKFTAWTDNRFGIVNNRPQKWPIDSPTTFEVLVMGNCVVTPGTMLIKRTALGDTSPFNTGNISWEDWEAWLGLSLKGDIIYLRQMVLNYRLHSDNKSSNTARVYNSERLIVKRWLLAEHTTKEQGRLMYLGFRYRQKRVAKDKLEWSQSYWKEGQYMSSAKEFLRASRYFVRFFVGYI